MHGCLTLLFLSLSGGNPSPKIDISQEISCLYLGAWMTSMNRLSFFTVLELEPRASCMCALYQETPPSNSIRILSLKDPQKARPLG